MNFSHNLSHTEHRYCNKTVLKPCKFGGSGDVGDSCKLGDSGQFWVILRNLVILVNLVDLVILATPVASCDSRISVESGEYGDSVEF